MEATRFYKVSVNIYTRQGGDEKSQIFLKYRRESLKFHTFEVLQVHNLPRNFMSKK